MTPCSKPSAPTTPWRHRLVPLSLIVLLGLSQSGCLVVSAAGAVVGTAVSVGSTVVGTAIDVGAAAGGAVKDALTDD